MTSIQENFVQAELSLASYALLEAGQPNTAELIKDSCGMSPSQAAKFAEAYTVVDQYTDFITGISATIFKDKSGALMLAVRGTEASIADILADAVLATGVPAKLNQQYQALKTHLVDVWLKTGGPLAGKSFTVTGHSLGGYLAAAIKDAYPDSVTAAYLYNAPGGGGLIGNFVDLVSGLFNQSSPGANNIWNIKGSEGASFITGLGSQGSPGFPVHIEQDSGIGFNNHSIVRLTDALAIHALYARLFPALSPENRNLLLDASGRTTDETLEAALDALRKLILGPEIESTSTDRNAQDGTDLYTHLYALQKSPRLSDLGSLTASLLTGKNAAQLLEMANADTDTGRAIRYALDNLNPFYVTGLRYDDHNAKGELDLYDPQSGKGSQTDEYLKDRAALLERKLWFSTEDKNPVDPARQSGDHLFENEQIGHEDIGNRYRIAQGTLNDANPRIVFGGGKSDVLEGKEGDDRLYGMAGLDVLAGNQGNDHLEGGQGLDLYRFMKGDGTDTVLDTGRSALLQRNNELLVLAFKDGEVWKGGTGDNAFTATRSGDDLILSFTDNEEDRITLKHFDFDATKTGAGSYGLRLIENPATAATPVRTFLGDTEDWDSDPTKDGVQRLADGYGNYLRADGQQEGRDLIEQAGRADLFLGSAGGEIERFVTGAGNDVIHADGPDSLTSLDGGIDLIDAGEGRDIVAAGGGNDRIEGGADGDILGGNAGDDILYADSSNDGALTLEAAIKAGETAVTVAGEADLLSGDAGDDILIGSARGDTLLGGAGRDLLVGGGGNDNLYGDATLQSATLAWTATREVILADNKKIHRLTFDNAVVSPLDHAAGEADTLLGGNGDDWLFGGGGDDLLLGGSGEDVIFGGAGSDVLQGGNGNDTLVGDATEGSLPTALEGDDVLDGGDGDDQLEGNGGNDVLIGGRGNDTLIGGAGKDIYIFNKGDGTDILIDKPLESDKSDAAVLVLGEGIKRSDIKFRMGAGHGVRSQSALWIDLGDGDGVHVFDFDPDAPHATQRFGEIRFADGKAMSYADVLAQGFDLDGSEASETIYGTNTGDRILGFAGNDVLTGFDGNDVLDGGSGADVLDGGDGDDVLRGGIGNDRLIGGDGDDTYRFDRGDGADALIDSSGVDTLLLGEGISPAGMQVTHFQALDGAYYLDLDFGNGDRVSIQDGALGRLESVVFADGTVYGWRDLIARLPALDVVGTSGGELLPGTVGNDILDGGEGDDTIEAGAGDDVLIGGGGNDVLIGGTGMDTYHFGFGAGADTVIETGGESSLLVFEPGVMPIQLNLLRDGDDLVIGLRGQTDSIRLKDFHAGGQDWQFRFDGAEPLDFSGLMAAVSPDEGSVAALKNAYKAELMASFSAMMAGYGFKSGHDGSYRKKYLDQTGPGRIRSTEYVESLVFSDQVFDWTRRGLPTESQTSNKGFGVMIAEATGNVAPPPFPGWSFVPRGNTSRGSRSYGDEYVFVYTGALLVGTWNVPDPQSVTGIAMQTFVHEKISYRVETVIPMLEGRDGADGENFYVSYATAHHGYASYASAAGALVDAGSGDDVIRVVSGLGSLVAGRGAFLYGDDGNDSITGGGADDILIGGRGHDVLDGLDGGDAYHLLEEDVGDHIRDSGNDWDRFKAWFYRQHGISDPLLSEEYGGQWFVRLEGAAYSAGSFSELRAIVPEWARESLGEHARYVPPLPELPHIAANDYAAMEAWYGKGILREDTLHFGEGVTADNLLVMGCEDPDVLGGLLLHGPQGRLAVVELPRAPVAAGEGEPWLEEPPMFGTGIEYYRFADGTVLTLRQMVERMRADHDLIGGGADDVFILDRGNDRIHAGGGNDSLWGGAGDDELDGGAGDDFLDGGSGDDRLSGGEGDDVYRFGWNSGHDVVMEVAGGLNRIVFEDDVSMSDLRLERLANPTRDLVIRLGEENTASLTIVGWGLSAHGALIDSFQFGETGGFWSTDDILSELRAINSLPDASALPSSITVRAGEPFAYTLPAELFIDVEGDEVTVLVDDDYLPDWMSYDNATRTLCGTPPAWESDGVISLYLRVGDSYAEDYVSVPFAISVTEASIIDGTEADDRLNGTGRGEILHGNGGDDRLYGRGGDDWLFGGDGNDTLYGGDGNDVLEGDGGNDILHGDAGTDYLSGGDGDDRLNGGSGADDMAGGGGNDIYYVDDEGDSVFEEADNGIDKVVSTIGYTLGDDVENLTLSGSEAIDGTGNDLDNVIVGNAAGNVLSGMGGNDRLTGGAGNDTLDGGDGDDSLSAGDGDDVLLGGTGNDSLNGGRGADIMVGGAGNDTYHVDDVGDAIVELDDDGSDRVIATISHTLGDYIENLTLSGTETIDGTGNDLDNVIVGNAAGNVLRGMGGNDRLTGGAGNDTLDGGDGDDSLSAGDGDDVLLGGTGNDTLNGGRGADIMIGGAGDDTYYVDDAGDTVVEQAGEGVDRVIASVSHALGEHLENLKLSGGDAIDGFGNVLNNSLSGNAADNLLNGGSGNDSVNGAAGLDFLEGMDGDDVLTDTSGKGYFNGGDGADRLTGGADDDFFIGGNGNDTIRTGAGNDIIVFNKGDGYDTLTVGAGDKTLSLGGGLDYGDLRLRKAGNDLILDTGSGEGMAFRNWYAGTANRNVLTLQVIAEAMAGFSEGGDDPLRDQKVEGFDFKGLADAFDAARAANPGLTTWALADALTQFQLAGSDTAAIGGDLAYQYGRNGTLAGVGLDAARQVIGDAAFGSQAQALRPLGGLQEGAVRLS